MPNSRLPSIRFLFSHPNHFISLGFGSGLAKVAPGTFGTLAGLPLFWLIAQYSVVLQLTVIAALFVIGIYFCGYTGKALGIVDHGSIVWDEIVAIMLVLTFTPQQWQWWLAAFVLFRLFDIWKPSPIRQLEAKFKNGFGVMFDDLLAAVYAIASLQGLIWVVNHAR